MFSRRLLAPSQTSYLLPTQQNLALASTSFLVGAPNRLFSDSTQSFTKKPDGIGRDKWNVLSKELRDRQWYRHKTEISLRKHEQGVKTRLSTEINRVQSIWDKIADVNELADGTVSSNYILQKDS